MIHDTRWYRSNLRQSLWCILHFPHCTSIESVGHFDIKCRGTHCLPWLHSNLSLCCETWGSTGFCSGSTVCLFFFAIHGTTGSDFTFIWYLFYLLCTWSAAVHAVGHRHTWCITFILNVVQHFNGKHFIKKYHHFLRTEQNWNWTSLLAFGKRK